MLVQKLSGNPVWLTRASLGSKMEWRISAKQQKAFKFIRFTSKKNSISLEFDVCEENNKSLSR
jgi:macrodomain Ter protein organizer (MatP/YcbG family)